MKKRYGFVSNSSVSSFTCLICGEEVAGHSIGLDEAGMMSCTNDHTICQEHVEVSVEEMDENEEWPYEVDPKHCPVCRFEIYDPSEMAKYREKTRKVSREEVFAKIKEMNKRRRKLYDEEYIGHVCQQFELNDEMLLEEIRKFQTFDKYREFLYAK